MPLHGGGTAVVQSVKACVAYDSKSGRVHRIHRVVTLEGGREPSEEEIEEHVLGMLRRRGFDADGLDVLHISHDAIEPRTLYSVDPEARSLTVRRKLE
jgi:hypothetical protein